MSKGFLMLVLHAHLPYVRHPEHEYYLEERWFQEAVTDCYLPLLTMMDRLAADHVPFKLTMSLSPTLLSMLSDHLLESRYLKQICSLEELSEKEIIRLDHQPQFQRLAFMYRDRFRQARQFVEANGVRGIIHGFRRHMETGNLEIITCGATHGYFPLMDAERHSVKAQVAVAVQAHEHFLGRKPTGIWLPECGYFPGDDYILKDHGLKYFFTDSHGVLYSARRPRYAVFAPVYCPSGVAAFPRDPESSKQVWSTTEGYPGDYDYREYYRDIGYDLDFGYVWPYIHPEGIRVNTGIKYYRITGSSSDKAPYDPERAAWKAVTHAEDFIKSRERQMGALAPLMDRPPLVVSPYDAELFGHWWFEGPQFLERVLRGLSVSKQRDVQLITPSEYLKIFPVNQVTQPSMSSWGNKGYNEVWLEGSNAWIYPHLHQAAGRMTALAARFPGAGGMLRRSLNQAARELLLAQASDWAFIMKTGSMVDYAVRRTKKHLWEFARLYEEISENRIDPRHITYLEDQNNIFPFIDYSVFL